MAVLAVAIREQMAAAAAGGKPKTAIGAYPDPPPVYDPTTDEKYPMREAALVTPIIPPGAVRNCRNPAETRYMPLCPALVTGTAHRWW